MTLLYNSDITIKKLFGMKINTVLVNYTTFSAEIKLDD